MENPNEFIQTYEEELREKIEKLIRDGANYYEIQQILNEEKEKYENYFEQNEVDIQFYNSKNRDAPYEFLYDRDRYKGILQVIDTFQNNLIHIFDIFDDEDTNLHTEEETESEEYESEEDSEEYELLAEYIDNLQEIYDNYYELDKTTSSVKFHSYLQNEKRRLSDELNYYHDLSYKTGKDHHYEIKILMLKLTEVDNFLNILFQSVYKDRYARKP